MNFPSVRTESPIRWVHLLLGLIVSAGLFMGIRLTGPGAEIAELRRMNEVQDARLSTIEIDHREVLLLLRALANTQCLENRRAALQGQIPCADLQLHLPSRP